MKTKNIFGGLLTLCMIFTMLSVGMLTAFAADDLTVAIDNGASINLKDIDNDGYYEISTADELYAFAAVVNGGSGTINGELTADIIINENVLTEDGALNGDGSGFRIWTPIGNRSNKYAGSFDGNEHTVFGLYFSNNSVSYVGLFGCINESGKVQNAGIKDFYFYGGEFSIGGVVGGNEYGTVINCRSAGTVIGDKYVGGIVGKNSGTVTSCNSASTVSGNVYEVGGVTGKNEGTITNCCSIGAVDGVSAVGGVAGANEGTITNAYNTGAIIGDGTNIGGITGNNKNTITNCHNAGTVTGYSYVGGIAGTNYGTIANGCNTEKVWCYQYGGDVGGVVGENNSLITNCYNAGEVIGAPYVGGVTGDNHDTITNCYYLSGCSDKGIGLDVSGNDSIVSVVTEAQMKAESGEEGALIDLLNAWTKEQNDVKYENWHICPYVSTEYPSLNYNCTCTDNGENHIVKCTLCDFEAKEAHAYFYTATENAIIEACALCKKSASIKLVLPEAPVYSGNAHEASYTGSAQNPDVRILLQYLRYNEETETGYELLESAPVDAGTYIVRLSVGEIYIDKSITIATKDITLVGVEVTDKDYDGTPYVEIDTTYGYGGFKAYGISDCDSIKILCASAELASANAGTYHQVFVKGLTLAGEKIHNYTIVSEATVPVYNIWGNYESSVTVYEKNISINLLDQEARSLDAIDQSKWEIDAYYGLLEGHRIESLKLVAEMNEGSTKYGSISLEDGSLKIVDSDGNDVTANYSVSAYIATLTITCPDHDEFDDGFCKSCGGYEKATYNETENCYEIANAGQLFWFAEYVANISNEANAKLTDNIAVPEGMEWTPIYNLYGTFDGNYKTISGLNVSESDSDYIGFIGYVGSWADVRNLHITDSYFFDSDAVYVGAVVGYYGGGEMSNCYTDATVNVKSNGVYGALTGYTAYSTMKNCYAHDVLAGNGYYGSFEHCYYIGEDDEIDGTTAVTAEQLASGEVAYLLQSGILGEEYYDEDLQEWITSEPKQVWGQDLSAEHSYPVFSENKVYLSDGIYHNEVKKFAITANGTDGNKAVATVAVPKAGTYRLVFADYEQTRLNRIDIVTVTVERDNMMIPVTSENDITIGKDDKLMLWQDIKNLIPCYEAYIVK